MSARLDVFAPYLIEHLLKAQRDAVAMRVARLLARGEVSAVRDGGIDGALLAWFGHDSHDGMASISAAADFGCATDAAHWLRADPVHLRADATRLILFDADSVGLDGSDSDALLAHLNAHLPASDFRFERGAAATRWYVRMSAPLALAMASPRSLRGQAVEDSLDALRAAGALNRVMTEAQMLLYDAPINAIRIAQGRAPINSVWFWGGGVATSPQRGARAAVVGDDALLAACAQHAGIAHEVDRQALAKVLASTQRDVLLLDHVEAQDCNLPDFAALVLAPALAALARGRLGQLTIHTHSEMVTLHRAARWRVWRRAGVWLDALRRARDQSAT